MYNADQWKVMGILASELPKRAVVRTKQVVAHFRRRENADRIVRNSYRKLKEEGHIEIVERGEYRLTPAGVKFYNKMTAEGFKPTTKRAAADKPTKEKVAKKKVAKAPKARKVTKKAAAKKATKKATKPAKKAKTAAKKKVAKKKTKAKSKIAGLMQKAAASKPKAEAKPATKAPEPETKASEDKGNGNGVPGDKPKPATPLQW